MDNDFSETELPDQCRSEMRRRDLVHSFVAADTNKPNLSQLIKSEDYSSTHRLYRVTAMALKFVHQVRNRIRNPMPPSTTDTIVTSSVIHKAKLLWIKQSQSQILTNERFPLWKRQLGLFLDESGLWRCGGRMSNSSLSLTAQKPMLLDKNHHLAMLIVVDAHKRVMQMESRRHSLSSDLSTG